jgi:hypothetical protein
MFIRWRLSESPRLVREPVPAESTIGLKSHMIDMRPSETLSGDSNLPGPDSRIESTTSAAADSQPSRDPQPPLAAEPGPIAWYTRNAIDDTLTLSPDHTTTLYFYFTNESMVKYNAMSIGNMLNEIQVVWADGTPVPASWFTRVMASTFTRRFGDPFPVDFLIALTLSEAPAAKSRILIKTRRHYGGWALWQRVRTLSASPVILAPASMIVVPRQVDAAST